MLHIDVRTTKEQHTALMAILRDEGATLHNLRHNLDGLWVTAEITSTDGDWIISIDRAGAVERTQ